MNIIITGATGRMGKALASAAEKDAAVEVAAFVSPEFTETDEMHCQALADFKGEADCVVDFSHHAATGTLLAYCTEKKLPVVIATTGQSEEENAKIEEAAKLIPIFRSANMSLGVAFLQEVSRMAAALFPAADVEIVEIHHNQKLDAPSGTALMLGEAVRAARPGARLVMGRSGHAKRDPQDVGIQAVRMGNQVGTHTVYVDTGAETLSLTHTANDRALFADGALKAAKFLVGKAPGLYDMRLLVRE